MRESLLSTVKLCMRLCVSQLYLLQFEGHSLTMVSVGSGSFGSLLTVAIVQLLTIKKHQNLTECIDNFFKYYFT